jgi:hypothetical protein
LPFRDFANAAQFVFPALRHAVAMLGQEQAHRRETQMSGIKLEMAPAIFALSQIPCAPPKGSTMLCRLC